MMLFIDPDVCIDCDACRQQCRRGAIFAVEDVPEAWTQYVALNAQEAPKYRPITEPQVSLGFPIWECNIKPYRNVDSVA